MNLFDSEKTPNCQSKNLSSTTDNSKILMQEMSQKLRESLCLNQELSEVNHNLQEELRKVLTDLSDITRLNQQLSIENDNMRNRGGWILREQQEKLEREIADVQDQNSRLNRLVNMAPFSTSRVFSSIPSL